MRILITGSSGVIGTVLINGLSYDKTEFDLPTFDARAYYQLVGQLAGHDAIIHLAWNTKEDNFLSDFHHPDNTKQVLNVYRAAVAAKVPRVIMASSVHADRFKNCAAGQLLSPYGLPIPDSPYGAGKCFMESLGRYYAADKRLMVICIRFGGVNPENKPPGLPKSERQVWLSHADCVELVRRCLIAKEIPDNYAIINAVSNNKDLVHDRMNPVGWVPRDGAS